MRSDQTSLSAARTGRMPVYLSKHPRYHSLLPSSIAESAEPLLLSTGVLKPWMVSLFAQPWFSTYVERMEKFSAPGISLHIGLRKRFIDDEIRRAIKEGCRQVLIVGAGYDALSLRLTPLFPELCFVELDHPPTHRRKAEGVRRLGTTRSNLHLLGVDLTQQSFEDTLDHLDNQSYWSNRIPTAVIAEGLLMYLKFPVVEKFLDALRNKLSPGSRLLFSYLTRNDESEGQGNSIIGPPPLGKHPWLMRIGMMVAAEYLEWGIDPKDLKSMLEAHGFHYPTDADSDDPDRFDLRQRYLVPAGLGDVELCDLERVAVAYL